MAQARTAGPLPSRIGTAGPSDLVFRAVVTGVSGLVIAIFVALVLLLAIDSWPSIERYGLGFVTSSTWDPVKEEFGAWPYIYGTLFSSALALLIATPIAVGAAIFLAEYAPAWLRNPVSFIVELLAAIPSIIYGLWGFFVLAPVMRRGVEPFLKTVFENIPVLSTFVAGPALGRDILVAAVILAIMILPTIMSVAREVFMTVPNTQREGMIGLGATKWETITWAVLPYARSGVVAAAMLGLARALGETMAVTMVIGNSSRNVNFSLFTPGYTMASAIANQFREADKEIYFAAIVYVALVLLVVSGIVNGLARLIVWKFAGRGAMRA
ncbi:MAG: phosphate ABC transporter permease subunit PstC [Chloroflexi bacterium]|nr:phosphate ABC transporter permease subunit PstC [Chloroflexota bacterium]